MGVLLLSVLSLVLAGTDEDFYLTIIPVEGTVSIPPIRVVEASGLGGIHAFAADPQLAAKKVAELPGVIAASVTLEWPNQASIQIVEDSPVAVWREGGRQYWITGKGSLVPVGVGVPGLLLIESELLPVASDESIDEEKAVMAFVPEAVLRGALQLRELRPNIDVLYYRPSTGLSYQDGRGWRVHFGSGTDMQQKLVVYETIVEELLAREQTPSYISVSNQTRPYYLAQ
jgi:cell division septal protein FtsQ